LKIIAAISSIVPEIAKDVMIAILGASIALAGLLLVFSGFLFAQAASFPSTTPDEIINRYRNAGRWGLLPFLWALAVAMGAYIWMICPCASIYRADLVVFGGLIIVSALYGGAMLIWYL
jgi:hypothetical protein